MKLRQNKKNGKENRSILIFSTPKHAHGYLSLLLRFLFIGVIRTKTDRLGTP